MWVMSTYTSEIGIGFNQKRASNLNVIYNMQPKGCKIKTNQTTWEYVFVKLKDVYSLEEKLWPT